MTYLTEVKQKRFPFFEICMLEQKFLVGHQCHMHHIMWGPLDTASTPKRKFNDAKWVLPIKSLSSALITVIGFCSSFIVAFTGRISTLVWNCDFAPFGTGWGAAWQEACGQVFRKPTSASLFTYTIKNFFCSIGCFLTFPLTGFLLRLELISRGIPSTDFHCPIILEILIYISPGLVLASLLIL